MAKERFATLDAMRGVAALSVVWFHIGGLYGSGCGVGTRCDIPFGYLAVDLFFALSGFVLSYRYDAAFAGGLPFGTFMRLRAVRLYPIYWLGVGLGALAMIYDVRHGAVRVSTAALALTTNLALLPSPTSQAFVVPFPLNPPAWSLFYELFVANVLFGVLGSRLRGAVLAASIATGAVGVLLAVAVFGRVGVGSEWPNFAGGFPRVILSFFVGVAVRRLHHRRVPPHVPAVTILAVMIASFILPIPERWRAAYELACVVGLYPALIYLGAVRFEHAPMLGKLLGDASYAVYAIHYPLLFLLLRAMPRLPIHFGYPLAVAFVCAVLAVAIAADALYDRRARNVLQAVLLPRRYAAADTLELS